MCRAGASLAKPMVGLRADHMVEGLRQGFARLCRWWRVPRWLGWQTSCNQNRSCWVNNMSNFKYDYHNPLLIKKSLVWWIKTLTLLDLKVALDTWWGSKKTLKTKTLHGWLEKVFTKAHQLLDVSGIKLCGSGVTFKPIDHSEDFWVTPPPWFLERY